ncbi:MAG: hypothetical protein FWD36_03470 [Treponema sp.]|nr:hypothetical protein [Treponema sp.]
MKIRIKCPKGQVHWALLILLVIAACSGKKEDTPVIPPLSSPLSQPYIGFGVVNVSYTRVNVLPKEDHAEEGVSPGYLRRGAIVSIHERRLIRDKGRSESWVLVEGNSKGWLRESLVDVYDTELQARTASESMGR